MGKFFNANLSFGNLFKPRIFGTPEQELLGNCNWAFWYFTITYRSYFYPPIALKVTSLHLLEFYIHSYRQLPKKSLKH